MTNNILDKHVLDVEDIQRFLGIGRRQAYELVNSNAFHVVRIGRRIKVGKDAFLAWLNGNDNSSK
ncbi:helix-turn-helix domain-containing protein [Metabacillus sp. 22489]|uniref:helix-turn-helix domain-containing protein n=1 Tax=Metabacillus sp. 22489 TaxID=3453928 RepID=UPI003F84F06E